MKAWQAARDLQSANRNSQLSANSGQDGGGDLLVWWLSGKAKNYVFDGENHECFFCYETKGRMTTGMLPIVGAIWKCRDCEAKYRDLKGRH